MRVAAVDLGATSGRVMLGRVGPDELVVEAVHRFPNEPVRTPDGLFWDIDELYRQVLIGLRQAVARAPDLVSIGIDSWAVDYGLVRGGRAGRPAPPLPRRAHRARGGGGPRGGQPDRPLRRQRAPVPAVQHALPAERRRPGRAAGRVDDHADDPRPDRVLADRRRRSAERTNASTTGLLDLATGSWNHALLDRLGLPATLFPPLVDPGTVVGALSADVAAEIGRGPAHPGGRRGLARHRLGRGGRADGGARRGVHLLRHLVPGRGRARPARCSADPTFTNEGGVDGRVRYLRNVMGMWLLNECVRTWEQDGSTVDLDRPAGRGRRPARTGRGLRRQPSQPAARRRHAVPHRRSVCRGPRPTTPAEFARAICESLAAAYATAIADAERLSGVAIRVVHVVGGGSQNTLLAQLTADRTGRPGGRPGRWRPPRSATCWSRPARPDWSRVASKNSGPWSPGPTRRRYSSPDEDCPDEDRAVHHLPGGRHVPRGGAGDRTDPGTPRARGGLSRGADVLRPDAREHRLPEAGVPAGRTVRGGVRAVRRGGRPVRIVRRVRTPSARDAGRPSVPSTGSGRPGSCGPGWTRWRRRRTSCRSCWSTCSG